MKNYVNTVCPKTGKSCEDSGCNFVDCAAPDGYWVDNEFIRTVNIIKSQSYTTKPLLNKGGGNNE